MIRILAFAALFALPATAWGQSLLDGDTGSPNDPAARPPLRKHDHLRVRVLHQDLGTLTPFRPEEGKKGNAEAGVAFQLTAEVADVRPNGTMVIQARRRRTIDGADKVFDLTGEVSPSAVEGGRIDSDAIANLDVKCTAAGTAESTGGCWLGKVLSSLWPF